MELSLNDIVNDFAIAFKAVDATGPVEKKFKKGIGPFEEENAVQIALDYLKQIKNSDYKDALQNKRYPNTGEACDLVIPDKWAIEFKLARPFGNNGEVSEYWLKKVLDPYQEKKESKRSAIGDCIKLIQSEFRERKAVIIFGYEHTPPRMDLTVVIRCFELISDQIIGIRLGPRCMADFGPLIHPIHQQGKVFGWEVLGYNSRN